jgi:hypothetical protein
MPISHNTLALITLINDNVECNFISTDRLLLVLSLLRV